MGSTSARQRWGALVAAFLLLAVFAPALQAVAATEACPSTIPSAGFKDLAGSSADAVQAINCVAYYGIARGTGSTTFDPRADVSRWQMALFLVRTAQDLGVALPSGSFQGYLDTAALSGEAQIAINQLAQLGITRGTGPNTFAPFAEVPRWQMALFLTRLMSRAGISLPSGTAQGYRDILTLPAEYQIAINQIIRLGIAQGTTSTTFDPNGIVSRWQMALFLSRSLEVGRTTPYSVSLSLNKNVATVGETVSAVVTVRDLNGRAVAGRLVDVFVASSLDSAGRCVLDTDAKIGGGDAGTSTNCIVDNNDPKTNSNGQVIVSITHANVLETDSVYAWIGDNGETFDNDIVRTKAATTIQWTQAPSALVVDNLTARYGTQVQVKAQFTGTGGAAVPLAGQKIVFRVTRGSTTIISQSQLTDAAGTARLAYVGPPDPGAGDDAATTDTILAFWDTDGDGVQDAGEMQGLGAVTWDDDLPAQTKTVLTQSSVSGTAGQSVTLTMTVTDKFGQPVNGARVAFTVTGAASAAESAKTNNSGQVSFGYTLATGSGVDTIDATVDLGDDGSIDVAGSQVTDLTHYWVEAAGSLGNNQSFDLIAANTSANTVDVTNGTLYLRLTYDGDDIFTVNAIPRSIDQFEAVVTGMSLPAVGGTKELVVDYTTGAGSNLFRLTT